MFRTVTATVTDDPAPSGVAVVRSNASIRPPERRVYVFSWTVPDVVAQETWTCISTRRDNPFDRTTGVSRSGPNVNPEVVAVGVPARGVSVLGVGCSVGVVVGGHDSGSLLVGVAVGSLLVGEAVGVSVCLLETGPVPRQPAVRTTISTATMARFMGLIGNFPWYRLHRRLFCTL